MDVSLARQEPGGRNSCAPRSLLATITSKRLLRRHLGLKCSYGKFFSPLTEIPVGKTEISGTEPARKGSRGKARLIFQSGLSKEALRSAAPSSLLLVLNRAQRITGSVFGVSL